MCGIYGLIDKNEVDTKDIQLIEKMRPILSHRGPDYSDTKAFKYAVLGHVRLSIVDLTEEANQPLTDISNRFWIVFNGEIYNFDEIRDELIKCGHSFRTKSDTEVILESYKEWGCQCLDRFNGMWAFAIFDSIKNECFIARDRFGVKPLYYTWIENKFYFASEIKGILQTGIQREWNSHLFKYYFKNLGGALDSGNETVLKNISSLPAGHYLIVRDGKEIIRRWWNTFDNLVEVPDKFEDRVIEFRRILSDAVRIRLKNDVDTGVSLSGGMDSSAIYGLAKDLQISHQLSFASEKKEKDFSAFSVSYPESQIDESSYAQECVNMWEDSESLKFIYPKVEEFQARLEDIIWQQEAPMWNASVFAFDALYREISKKGIKVILEGHGSDEMLAGYPYLVGSAIKTFIDNHEWKNAWKAVQCLSDTVNPTIGEKSYPKWIISFVYGKIKLKSYFITKSRAENNHMNNNYINFNDGDKNDNAFSKFHSKLKNDLYQAFHYNIIPIVLRVFDRAAMGYGVESRAPFLDYRLVCYCFSLPEPDIVSYETKHILRQAVKDVVPEKVLNRKAKLGFAIPLQEWFESEKVKSYLESVFESNEFKKNPVIDVKRFQNDYEICSKKGITWQDTVRIWEVLNFFIWWKLYIDDYCPNLNKGGINQIE